MHSFVSGFTRRHVSACASRKPVPRHGNGIEGHFASSSVRGQDDSAAVCNPPKPSKMRQTKNVEQETDAGPQKRLYNWRDRLLDDSRIDTARVKTYSRVPRAPARIKQRPESDLVTLFDPVPDNYEPSMEMYSLDDENVDWFKELSPESRAELLPVVNNSLPTPSSYNLTTPKSRTSLYRNLLYLVNVRKPTTPLPSLVDYYNLYPQWQSTKSYNLLLDLSLRHRQFGMTVHLFRSLESTRLLMDLESHQLKVRYYVILGRWEKAWSYAWSLIERNKDPKGCKSIPFPIWLELSRSPEKRRRLSGPHESLTLENKYQILHSITPDNVPSLNKTTPFAVFCLVSLMLRTGREERAVSLTKAYFKTLPRSLNNKLALDCLRIIHAHMAYCTAKPGLRKYFASRRILKSFLLLHPCLSPTGRTLRLMFNSLKRAKKCGSVAWTEFTKFKKVWGPRVEDRRVLRVLSRLALKEGRLDITKKIHDIDFTSRIDRRERLREESLVGRIDFNNPGLRCRLPYRLIYPRNGREARLWYRHRVKVRLKRRRIFLKGLGSRIT